MSDSSFEQNIEANIYEKTLVEYPNTKFELVYDIVD